MAGITTWLAVLASIAIWALVPLALGYWLADWRALPPAIAPPIALYASSSGGAGSDDFAAFGLLIMLAAAVLFVSVGLLARHFLDGRRARRQFSEPSRSQR